MTVNITVPPFPESVEEGTLSAWHKKQGEAVQKNEKVADIETDKIVLEVMAQAAGVLKKISVPEGSTVKPKDIIGVLDNKAGGPATKSVATDAAPEPEPEPEPESASDEEDLPRAPAIVSRPSPAKAPRKDIEMDERLGPAVRKLILEHDLDPQQIEATGRGGRITKADVLRFLEHSPHLSTQFGASERETSSEVEQAPAPTAKPPLDEGSLTRRVKMSRIRARIAERLVEAQSHAALLTTFNEVDMKAIMGLRKRYQEAFQSRYKIKLGFMSFFVRAVTEALERYPVINASVEGDEILYHGYYNIGVAVSSDRGLVVPTIRNADRMSLAELELAINDFGTRAQQGKLDLEELTGGTFTISNGGVFGSMMSTPIINPPQSAILGMHRIQERPVVVDGEVVIRPMMYLALTYDHRIIDGRDAVQFLVSVKESIEEPARMLLEI
ncbi:MAG: 2-oxoglutarate dehydrogenase complex dihydrolipoyllysine-residue succinyltransferase [Verrucomicrobia bacterium]|nr:2-oxoglutarate dehydrogenase complex dihydrolipoyllysine-residue succinyltransferase [Verrucomicrobiota bacterium]